MAEVTDAEIQDISRILAGVLSPDNGFRKQCEGIYNSTLAEHPNKLFICLVYNLKHPEIVVRTLASVLLKKLVAPFSKTEV